LIEVAEVQARASGLILFIGTLYTEQMRTSAFADRSKDDWRESPLTSTNRREL
jgi:hypothetical protein